MLLYFGHMVIQYPLKYTDLELGSKLIVLGLNQNEKNNCCPPENKVAALSLQVYKCFFQVYLKTTNLTETKNTQQATGNAVEIL